MGISASFEGQTGRIEALFESKNNTVLSIFFTAGFPRRDDTLPLCRAAEEGGADLIEIGVPFSDPVADGPTIQHSNGVALGNGMSLKLLFEQLSTLRQELSLPVLLMGYLNPLLQYGFERFCLDAKRVGVDGLIVPDLPIEVYQKEYQNITEAAGLRMVFLVTPQTPDDRIRFVDSVSRGFIYAVSSAAVTGTSLAVDAERELYFKRLRDLNLKNPVLVGFGISDKEAFLKASQYVAGAIVGSAVIRAISDGQDPAAAARNFIRTFAKSAA